MEILYVHIFSVFPIFYINHKLKKIFCPDYPCILLLLSLFDFGQILNCLHVCRFFLFNYVQTKNHRSGKMIFSTRDSFPLRLRICSLWLNQSCVAILVRPSSLCSSRWLSWHFLNLCLFILLHNAACSILVPQPGNGTHTHCRRPGVFNQWTTKEVSLLVFLRLLLVSDTP